MNVGVQAITFPRVGARRGQGLGSTPQTEATEIARARAKVYLLDGEKIEAISDAAGRPISTFLHGAVIDEIVGAYHYDERGQKTFRSYYHDAVTSVTALADHTGAVQESYDYSPFGRLRAISVSGSSANTLRYTGREADDSGLYYYRARYYDPLVRRFLTEDPIGFAGGVNFYAYAGNDPVRFNDPSGEFVLGFTLGGGLNFPFIGPIGPAGGASVTFAIDDNFDFIVVGTPELGLGIGEGGTAFARGVVSFDKASKVENLLEFGVSVSADLGPVSGSATKPINDDGSLSDITFFELGVDRPVTGFDASVTVGFGVRLAGSQGSGSPTGVAPGPGGGSGSPGFDSEAGGGLVRYPSEPGLGQLTEIYRK